MNAIFLTNFLTNFVMKFVTKFFWQFFDAFFWGFFFDEFFDEIFCWTFWQTYLTHFLTKFFWRTFVYRPKCLNPNINTISLYRGRISIMVILRGHSTHPLYLGVIQQLCGKGEGGGTVFQNAWSCLVIGFDIWLPETGQFCLIFIKTDQFLL